MSVDQLQNSRTPVFEQTKLNLLLAFAGFGLLVVLPHAVAAPYSLITMSVGASILLTAWFWVNPKALQSGGGSSRLGYCLIATMWLITVAIVIAASLGWFS